MSPYDATRIHHMQCTRATHIASAHATHTPARSRRTNRSRSTHYGMSDGLYGGHTYVRHNYIHQCSTAGGDAAAGMRHVDASGAADGPHAHLAPSGVELDERHTDEASERANDLRYL